MKFISIFLFLLLVYNPANAMYRLNKSLHTEKFLEAVYFGMKPYIMDSYINEIDDINVKAEVDIKIRLHKGGMIYGIIRQGDTALIIAAMNNRHEIVRKLIKARADLNATDRDGYTALHHAVALYIREHCNIQAQGIINDLIQAGANPNFVDKQGNTPLMNLFNCYNYTRFSTMVSPSKVIKLLLDAGTDIYWRNKQEKSVFFLMKYEKRTQLLKQIIDHQLKKHKEKIRAFLLCLKFSPLCAQEYANMRNIFKPYILALNKEAYLKIILTIQQHIEETNNDMHPLMQLHKQGLLKELATFE